MQQFADMTPEEQRRASWLVAVEQWERVRQFLVNQRETSRVSVDVDWSFSDDEAVKLLREAVSLLREEMP